MKNLIVLGALFVGAGVAASGVAFYLSSSPTAAPRGEVAAIQPRLEVASPEGGSQVAELRDEVAKLGATVRQIQVELEALRSSSRREPVALEEEAPEPAQGLAALSNDQFAQQVRSVLMAERQREEQQAELERLEREKQNAIRTAERIGERLALAPADTTRLADHLVAAQDKRNTLMQQVRDSGFEREDMRATFEQLRDWNNTELIRLFGPDVGGQIAEQTNNLGGRGGPGAFGGQAGGRRGGGGG